MRERSWSGNAREKSYQKDFETLEEATAFKREGEKYKIGVIIYEVFPIQAEQERYLY